ncbi:MAG: hypothetical protein HYV07_15340 [Deltaproteobacteria bacterium]|nr:hypothetical protein [Deltaproteobacteria bacterium]
MFLRLGFAALVASVWACEDTALFVQPEVDAGFPEDADAPDADEPDMGIADTGALPPAPDPIYVHTGAILYSYDPETNTTTPVGAFRDDTGPVENMVDMAIDREGQMYGGTLEKKVVRIDPRTARVQPLFDFDDILHGMTFVSDGSLVIAGQRVTLVDPQSGRVNSELVPGSDWVTSGDVVGLPDGKLYWTVKGAGAGAPDDLVRIDPTTGDAARLGSAGVEKIFGLGYARGSLYGFSSGGRVVVLDSTTGASKEVRRLDGVWWGATTNPVRW